jgi:hypothetical protein
MTPNARLLISAKTELMPTVFKNEWAMFVDNDISLELEHINDDNEMTDTYWHSFEIIVEKAILEFQGEKFELFQDDAGLWAIPVNDVYLLFKR